MRSARSASRVLAEEVWWWPGPKPWWWGKEAPRWPSLMAMVERAEIEVVAELGVPLFGISKSLEWSRGSPGADSTYGASVGVSGLEGGSGISIKVGVAIL